MGHVVAFASGVAVDTPVNTSPAYIHAVVLRQNAFVFPKVHGSVKLSDNDAAVNVPFTANYEHPEGA
jgi:hypothetical protein